MRESQRLLIVGDLRTEVDLVERRLKPAGLSFTSNRVECPDEFTEAVERTQPDLIIFDCSQPGLDEESALQMARHANSSAPFIITGKQESLSLSMECMNAGAFAFVPKSHPSQFTNAVISALERGRFQGQPGEATKEFRIDRAARDRAAVESRRLQFALRSPEEKYRKFFEEGLSGNYIATSDGHLLACNAAFAQMFGFDSVEDAMKANLTSLYPDPKTYEETRQALRKAKKLARHETELRRKDGKTIHVVENAVGTFDAAGELREINGFIIDDTDRKKLEDQFRQSQKMEAIGRLAGGVAHDFNNLLSCIMGYCDFLLSDIEKTNPLYADAEEIRVAGERASALVRQLLAFSRRQVLQPRILDLNEVLLEMEKMVRRLIGEDIILRIVPGTSLGTVRADRGQIEQVVMNLVVNARDAMLEGGELTIETANAEPAANGMSTPGPHVMISVRDSGCGMTKEVRSHLFEPFFTTKERGKGTGLGLSTVYGIVKQSGGCITVDSEEGRGTTFRIYLPKATSGEAGPAPKLKPQRGLRGFETVLVVEDDEALKNLTAKVLRANGYVVLSARSGEEGLALCASHKGPIHLLVTDLVMPGISGKDLARQIRETRPETRVLFVSGYFERAGVELSEAALHETLLAKPFNAEALGSAVRSVLDRE